MKKMDENSIDTIITDPPYGLSFMGKKWDYDVPSIETFQEMLRVAKPGATMLCFAGSRTQHRMAVNIEDAGWILKDCIMWLYGSGFPKATDISKQLDKGHERKVVETVKTQPKFKYSGAGKLQEKWIDKNTMDITEPTTPEAKLWNGWKSHGLKPSYEPILLCMKPNDGTYANNALKHGVSGLNIDGGRIGTEERTTPFMSKQSKDAFNRDDNWEPKDGETTITGRFPANVLLDEDEPEEWRRYFYCAKASKAERNKGCEGLEEKEVRGGGGRVRDGYDDKDVEQQRLKKAAAAYGAVKVKRQNSHPTVKPLKLMEYLCTLTATPTKGCVLDPFCGSGTTGLACQNTGRDFIGIEMEPEYIEIAKARIKANEKLI